MVKDLPAAGAEHIPEALLQEEVYETEAAAGTRESTKEAHTVAPVAVRPAAIKREESKNHFSIFFVF